MTLDSITAAAKKYFSTASICATVILSTYQFSMNVNDQIKSGFDSMSTTFIESARQPFYLSQEYSLKKQLEKLEKDPADLKVTDIEFLYILCQDEFGTKYIPSLPANRKSIAQRACTKIGDMYTSRSSYDM